MLFTNSTEFIILLVVCAVAAACFVAALVLLIWTVNKQRRKQNPVRELTGISVDVTAAKREFALGEEFTCDGISINAEYNLEPTAETLTQYDVLTEEELTRLTAAGTANGLYVIKPDLTEAGRAIVIIKYKDRATFYPVSVAEPVAKPAQEAEEEPAPVALVPVPAPPVIAEESFEGVLRYNKSFTAKYIQSGDEVKNWYTALKNEMLSYKKVKARMSWKREIFRLGREAVARLAYRGNTLCVYFPLNAADYTGSKYKVEDVSESASYADTPCMYRLKNGRRARYALELFAAVMERMGGVRTERIAEDYYLPYEGVVELIEKGLIKRVVKSKTEEAAFLRPAEEPAAEPVEEPAEEVAEEVAATAETVEENN